MNIIMIGELDNGLISKTIVEAFEEVSHTKGVIGYHGCCFTEESASADLDRLPFCITL
jgi:hypothetical protein